MRFLNVFEAAIVLAVIFPGCSTANATAVYIAQTAAGSANGSNCANAYAVTFFNTAANWGSGASQIGPGTVVNLCGTITSQLQINGSGTSGNVIEILWTTGATVSVPYGQIINLNGSYGYLLFDGGTACGPGTSCDTVETANQRAYATGQAGIIEATANGSALANQNIQTQAFYGCNGCHDIEIRNLIIRNMYVHSSTADSKGSADTGNFAFQCSASNSGCAAGTISIHNSTIHDNGNAISLQKTNSVTFNVYNVDFYNNNWAMENSGNGTRTLNFHDNHVHDTSNWDTSADAFHHNGLHSYMNVVSDSLGINLYNNLSDGNWGSCCTTATQLYTETDLPANFNVFNNICIQHAGNVAPCWGYGATTGVFANNTAIGVASTSSNVEAIELYGGSTGITFENNTVEGYGQIVVVSTGVSASTFTALDYNQYGPIGKSGSAPFQWGGTAAHSLAQWLAACSCDSHSAYQSGGLGINSSGAPQNGSVLIGAGVNLTGLGIPALSLGTSDGGTVTPIARSVTAAWDVGAFPYSFTNPPTALIVVTQ